MATQWRIGVEPQPRLDITNLNGIPPNRPPRPELTRDRVDPTQAVSDQGFRSAGRELDPLLRLRMELALARI